MSELPTIALSNLLMACLFAVLAMLAGRWSQRPALVHGLWLLFFVKLLTPPLFPVSMVWSRSPPVPESNAAQERPIPAQDLGLLDVAEARLAVQDENDQLPLPAQEPLAINMEPVADLTVDSTEFPLALVLTTLWLTGSGCWFLLAGARLLRFGRQLRLAKPASEILQGEVQMLANKLEATCPKVWVLPGRLSPMLWVLGRTPRLLLPAGLLDRLEDTQRQALLVHELAHWRRRDHWVRRLELVALGLYWWCPLVWWARRQMQEAEEECCDAWVLWLMPEAARGYALALVETLDFMAGARTALPPVASGVGHVRLLQRRLTMIMRGTTSRTLTLGGLAVLGLGALLLPLVPSWAQSPSPPEAAAAEHGPPVLREVPYLNRLFTNGALVQQESQPNQPEPKPNPNQPEPRDPAEQRRQAMERAQQEYNAMQAELDRDRLDFEMRGLELNARSKYLRRMMEQLQNQFPDEPKPGDRKDPSQPGPKGPVNIRSGATGGGGFGGGFSSGVGVMPPSNTDKRLRDVERKLDILIDMMSRKGQGPGGPIPPGGAAPRFERPAGAVAPPTAPPIEPGVNRP